MIKIMFVCHGNICRSPMAEFLMKDLLSKRKDDRFSVSSAATSGEEIGSPVHYGTKRILNGLNIDCSNKRAVRLTQSDYDKYDYFICMDDANVHNTLRIFGGDKQGKTARLLDFTDNPRSVADPWYTGDFAATYNDISLGVNKLYEFLCEKHFLRR